MTAKQTKPNASKRPAIPKVVQAEIDEFKRTLRELEIHTVEKDTIGWTLTVSAPKFGDARMLEEALSIGSARFKRMEYVDQYTLGIHL